MYAHALEPMRTHTHTHTHKKTLTHNHKVTVKVHCRRIVNTHTDTCLANTYLIQLALHSNAATVALHVLFDQCEADACALYDM